MQVKLMDYGATDKHLRYSPGVKITFRKITITLKLCSTIRLIY